MGSLPRTAEEKGSSMSGVVLLSLGPANLKIWIPFHPDAADSETESTPLEMSGRLYEVYIYNVWKALLGHFHDKDHS